MLWAFILLIIGLVLLIFAADLLVRGASDVARRFGISSLIIGLTVVAFGTSAPELFVSVAAALKGSADVAIGNVLGSNVFNILIIVGIASLLAPINASREIVFREMPIMIGAMVCFWGTAAFVSRGVISSTEGIILFCLLLVYLLQTFLTIRKQRVTRIVEEKITDTLDTEIRTHGVWKDIVKIALGLAGLIFGSELIVENATSIARAFGISEFIIGVTLIAGGTSLPELATTALAAMKKENELAIGNAVGSNIFNVFCVIGLSAFIQPLQVAEANITIDFPVMVASCFMVWIPLLISRGIGRVAGSLFIIAYGMYVTFLIVRG
jgi:cation:H+ antiporter